MSLVADRLPRTLSNMDAKLTSLPISPNYSSRHPSLSHHHRTAFWKREIGRGLQYLLKRVSCPRHAADDFMDFFESEIIPLLGPTPQEFQVTGMKPCTFFSDDHTPAELIWAIDNDGSMSIRFAMEPLNYLDGTPSPASDWMSSLHKLRTWHRTLSFDLEWTNICRETLIYDDAQMKKSNATYTSQFFLGGDFSNDGMVGKFYFLPHLRATQSGVAPEELFTECITQIGILEPWNRVLSYMRSLPPISRPTLDMVAVDCVPSEKNRIKAYFRSQATTLDEVCEIVSLGGILNDDPLIRETTDLIERLWTFIFPGVGRYDRIKPCRPRKAAHGFLIYFEMRLGSRRLWPKVYFPVRQYCESDAFIANAISQFYAGINNDVSTRYTNDMKNIFKHRDLSSRTGIHTYLGCCIRKGGPQLSMYMSPEVFAHERKC